MGNSPTYLPWIPRLESSLILGIVGPYNRCPQRHPETICHQELRIEGLVIRGWPLRYLPLRHVESAGPRVSRPPQGQDSPRLPRTEHGRGRGSHRRPDQLAPEPYSAKVFVNSGGDSFVGFCSKEILFTFDDITKIAFGDAFGFLTTDSNVFKPHQEVGDSLPALLIAFEVPWIRSIIFLQPFLKLFGPRKSGPAGVGRVSNIRCFLLPISAQIPPGELLLRFVSSVLALGGSETYSIECPFSETADIGYYSTRVRAWPFNLCGCGMLAD